MLMPVFKIQPVKRGKGLNELMRKKKNRFGRGGPPEWGGGGGAVLEGGVAGGSFLVSGGRGGCFILVATDMTAVLESDVQSQ